MSIAKSLIAAFIIFTASSVGQAKQVSISFSGTVDAITDTSNAHDVPASVMDNVSTFVGMFSYNDAASPVSAGIYRGTSLNLSATVTIDGMYTYTLTTPTSDDEIDLIGNSFEFFKRGPTVQTAFAPMPPFSHFEFIGPMNPATTSLPAVQLTGAGASAGVSDQQTPTAPYWFIGAGVSSTPEPSSAMAAGVFAPALLARRRRGRI